MVTVIQRHCAGIKSLENVTLRYQDNKDHVQNIIYSDGMIAQQNTSGVISDPNECSHSSARKKQIKNNKKLQSTTVTVIRCHCAGTRTNSP